MTFLHMFHRMPRHAVVREAGLVDASGWISVDRLTLETAHAGVYAVGDVTSIPLSLGKPLPKAGTFAEGQARVAAMNIVHQLTARGRPASFGGHGECLVETGAAKAAYGGGNFYAEPLPQVALKRPGPLLAPRQDPGGAALAPSMELKRRLASRNE